MNDEVLKRHFEMMGARVRVGPKRPSRGRFRAMDGPLAIDVVRDKRGEYFDIQVGPTNAALDVVDVRPRDRHLLLLVRLAPDGRMDKFLCGHDERAWFVAAVPEVRGVSNVQTAMEALKPQSVRDTQARLGVSPKRRNRRRNAAFVRQGEWFFIPRPELQVHDGEVFRDEPLRRGDGKPHQCQFLFRTGGETVYVSRRQPNGLTEREYGELITSDPRARTWGWQMMRRDADVYVKGRVSHPDHATIVLACWHRVQMNTDTQARAMQNVRFLD